ncbi:hypothetical protein [Sphingomonas sp. Leaf38]|nr:hypothetical protein [Sphingomonas sp. Leaf38]
MFRFFFPNNMIVETPERAERSLRLWVLTHRSTNGRKYFALAADP